jgi:hypothetical protein
MATFTSSTHRPLRPAVADGQSPAVVNVRRPQLAPADAAPERIRAADGLRLDDAPPPPTVLRLPEVAADVASLRPIVGKFKMAAIAQWAGIGLGALLALWLIFGGRTPARQMDEAPAWSAPAAAPADSPPAWNGPGSGRSAAPAPQESPPPGATAPEFDPFDQLQPGGDANAAAAPADATSARGSAAHPTGQADGSLRTAQRPPDAGNADGYRPSEAQPLNVTVPVRQ